MSDPRSALIEPPNGPPVAPRYSLGDVLAVALTLGLAGGIIEGPGHILIQRLNLLDNVWYAILWIAPVFNGLLVALVGLAAWAVILLFPQRPLARRLAIFVVVLAACLPWVVLLLKEWIHTYAILFLVLGLTTAITRWLTRGDGAGVRVCRRSVGWLIAATALLFFGVEGGAWLHERNGVANLPAAPPSAPDIIVVVVDALRADHVSAYGYSRPTSPHIDRLAAEGVLFEQAYSTTSYTLPSHASILTGLYPDQHGVEWLTPRAHASGAYPTLAETLKNRGYRTGAFSGNTFWFTRAQGFGRGFLHFDDFFDSIADRILRTAYGRMVTVMGQKLGIGFEDIPARKRAPATNKAVLDWLDRDVVHPNLVVINYMDVHDPYLPPAPFRTRFSTQVDPGGRLNWLLHVPPTLTADELQGEIDAYDGAIAFVDEQIGALTAAVRQRQRGRDLLVVLTSDHGDEFFEHGHFLHARDLYREVIHVPLIVWSPGRVTGGIRIAEPVSNAAIPSTLMRFLDPADRTFSGSGAPLQPLWETPDVAGLQPLPMAMLRQRPWAPKGDPVHDGSLWSVMSPLWHYIEHTAHGPELYRWPSDLREATNVAGDPSLRPVLEDLQRLRHGPSK